MRKYLASQYIPLLPRRLPYPHWPQSSLLPKDVGPKNHSLPTFDPECDCALKLLYLSDLLAKVNSRLLLEEMISVSRNGTSVTWQHVNLLGEYDFIKLLDNKSLRFDLECIFQWKYEPAAKEPVG